MTATKQMRNTVALLLSIVLAACSSASSSAAADIQSYTGIELCPAAVARDITTQEERDMTLGFSSHVALKLDAACAASFERQLASIAPVECASKRVHSTGCYAIGDETKTGMHTTIIVRSTGEGLYDVRLFT